MYFKQVLNEQCGCASYVIACHTRAAAIIDPAADIGQYEDLFRSRSLQLRYILDTHVHADHISGARRLRDRHGAELCMFESARVAFDFTPLADGTELELGTLRLRVVHTPGHRPELMSILVVNPPRSPEPSMVLTGDSLLVGDVGRPDFGGGDAAAQYDSISRLLRLPDWVAVFPGHFEGPCGKGMCGRPSTTIGFERLFNPLARLDRAQFTANLTSEIPARPLNMAAIEATNRGLAEYYHAMLASGPPSPEVGIDDLDSLPATALLLDVREPEEFAHGHVPGALNIPQCDLATRSGEIALDRSVLVICQSGFRSQRSAQYLKQIGCCDVASVRGGTAAWRDSGRPLAYGDPGSVPPRISQTEWTHAGAFSYEI